MNAPKKTKQEVDQTPIFEPFPEPRTMPDGWDLSALLPGSNPPDEDKVEDYSTK